MQSVIISVKLRGREKEYDLEVPAEVPGRKLAELITHNIDPNASNRGALTVRCLKPGPARLLPPDASLAGAGLWDGVLLEIGPADPVADHTWADILLGWDPLTPAEPIKAAPASPMPKPPAVSLPKAKPADSPLEGVEWRPLAGATPPTDQTDKVDDGWRPA